jgi:NAD(P)H-dependent FMN reductase
MNQPAIRLLVIPGSSRTGSLNMKLAKLASSIAINSGSESSVVDLRALNLPIYDGDFEDQHGVPEGAKEFVRKLHNADALLFVTPEYNSFPPPLLINALDWASRVQGSGDQPGGMSSMADKPASLLSASPGALGGIKSIQALRTYLQGLLGMVVLSQQYSLGNAGVAFSEEGELTARHKARSAQKCVTEPILALFPAL